MKPKRWYCEVYKMRFLFFIRWNPAKFKAHAQEKYALGERSIDRLGGAFFPYEGERGETIILWSHPEDRKNCYLMHECIHAANYTLNACGVETSQENDEALAYLAETIFRKAIT